MDPTISVHVSGVMNHSHYLHCRSFNNCSRLQTARQTSCLLSNPN